MQAPPDDLFQRDSTIPTEDPAIAASRVKQQQQLAKERAALEAQEKKRAAEEAKKVKKDMATPGNKEKAAAVVTAEKRELKKHKIRLYFEKLGHKLSMKPPKSLPNDDAAIDELLASIECELHSNGGIEQAGTAYVSGMTAIEQITTFYNPLGLALSGPAASLSSTVAQNKEKWDELITEFAISNAEWFMVSLCVLQTGILLCFCKHIFVVFGIFFASCWRRCFPISNGRGRGNLQDGKDDSLVDLREGSDRPLTK